MDERCPAREYNHDDFGRHVPDPGQAAVACPQELPLDRLLPLSGALGLPHC